MSAKGIVIAEQGHIAQMIIPQTVTSPATSEVINMGEWGHATILVHGGAGSALTITVSDASSFAAAGASRIVYRYAKEDTAAGDVLDAALAWAGTAGVAIGSGTGVYMVIEIDADELRDGFPYLQINLGAASSKIISAAAILSGGRFQKDITSTVIV